jgi:Zn-dependent protease
VFGYASAPFDPYWAMRHPKRAAWMAMAGPGANLVLAAVAVLALKAGLWTGVFHPGETIAVWKLAHAATPVAEAVAVFFSILYFENLLLATWNLLPIPPMDGFSMLLFVVPESKAGTVFAIRNQLGLMFPILIFVLSGVFWRFFRPVLWYTIDLFFG